MKRLALLSLLLATPALAQQLPSPQFQNVTIFGTATLNGPLVQNAPLDPATFAGSYERLNTWNTTLTPLVTTTKTFEQNTNAVTLNGPGVYNAEINAGHAFIQVNAGANAPSSETFETSAYNFGTMGGFTSYLGFLHNQSTGTATGTVSGVTIYLKNENPAPGAVSVFAAFDYEGATSGAGSLPGLEFCAAKSLLDRHCYGPSRHAWRWQSTSSVLRHQEIWWKSAPRDMPARSIQS